MKILVIGASGTIGKAVSSELEKTHDVVRASRSNPEFPVDITDPKSVQSLFDRVGRIDAIVVTAGHVHFGPMKEMTPDHFHIGLNDKLMGQVNVVLIGQRYLKPGGSFTLTSGILADQPIASGVSASMINGALHSFVMAAAVELPNGFRINCVSPTVLTEALPEYEPYFRGFDSVSGERVAMSYVRSIEGLQTGQVFRIYS